MSGRPAGRFGDGAEARTLQQRMGFVDVDLKTPAHDALLLWADQNAQRIARQLFPPVTSPMDPESASKMRDAAWTDWCWEQWGRIGLRVPEQAAQMFASSMDAATASAIQRTLVTGVRVTEQTWEVPVMDRTFTVGFVDLEIVVDVPHLGYMFTERDPVKPPTPPAWCREDLRVRIAVEIKAAIPSLGELVRQVRLYQQYLPKHRFVVLSPDYRFAPHLEKQGIDFVRFEHGGPS